VAGAILVTLAGHDLVGLLAGSTSPPPAWSKCAGCEPGAWVLSFSERSFCAIARVLVVRSRNARWCRGVPRMRLDPSVHLALCGAPF
jgi:hypothetical protein